KVLQDGFALEHGGRLERADDAEPGDLVHAQTGNVPAAIENLAGRRRDGPGDEVEQGCIASAVRSDDAEDLAASGCEADTDDRRQAAEVAGKPMGLEHDLIRHRLKRAPSARTAPISPSGMNSRNTISSIP